jgi:hypothetical protein
VAEWKWKVISVERRDDVEKEWRKRNNTCVTEFTKDWN